MPTYKAEDLHDLLWCVASEDREVAKLSISEISLFFLIAYVVDALPVYRLELKSHEENFAEDVQRVLSSAFCPAPIFP